MSAVVMEHHEAAEGLLVNFNCFHLLQREVQHSNSLMVVVLRTASALNQFAWNTD